MANLFDVGIRPPGNEKGADEYQRVNPKGERSLKSLKDEVHDDGIYISSSSISISLSEVNPSASAA
jgi:hypothetical protein